MNAYELKEYISKHNKIEEILLSLGCHSITQNNKETRCALPDKTNPTALRVYNDSLSVRSFASGFEFKGDIYTLVMELRCVNFVKAVGYIADLLGVQRTYKKKEEKKVKSPSSIFKKKRRYKDQKYEVEIFHKEAMRDYIHLPHINFIREGILKKTHDKFSLAFDPRSNRIVIPHRYWAGEENDFIGIMGRTIIENHKELGIHKYFPLKRHYKSMNLYGLNENYKEIQEKGYVVIYEAEKSVLKRHTRDDGTGVALCMHEISDEQVAILISLNVEIIVAMDKDIQPLKVWEICDKFYRKRMVSYIKDTKGLIGEKDSPADAHNDDYKTLFNNRYKYDERHHEKYLEKIKEGQEKKYAKSR
jgi:DNA primase